MRTFQLTHVALLVAVGCGGDDGKCDQVAQTGCDNGQVCEQVSGGQAQCFAPVEVDGKVLDLATHTGIANARVVALDINGTAVSNVVETQTDGTYRLPIPTPRNSDGTPASALGTVTLRADAKGYASYPGTVRQPLPLDLTTATGSNGGFVYTSALTTIGLQADAAAGAGEIHGKVAVPEDHAGVLVVAELNGKGYSAVAASDGDYAILDLPAGHYAVTGYAVGHVYTPAETDVSNNDVALDLALATDMPGSATGSVQIVDPGSGTATSIVLFVESTYDAATGRGVEPPNLRAPGPGVAPNITGAFQLDGVPPGKYVAVGAFENDGLVRDPDHCIAGTADIHITVTAGQALAISQGFKITGAIPVVGPGATTVETVTSAMPTFSWAADPSADQYVVDVFDSFGQKISTKTVSAGASPSLTYGGDPALLSGAYYQFRVTSLAKQGSSTSECELSRTEDLRGVFIVP